ncbi:hypothetical protein [Verrucosispora sp. WMMD1129]|uniref:hypothetical protein n=1 Tax=Verrucosispora sp. WMMD1129 TaxID=3016093 RepID=UPI00249C08A1|nr:hypothetical protein [Verrucosispora sp. WMMD1129]WFE45323.1 hypothetical protein O7624_13660 [Verrucosispora sp. WMMD1129]
MKRRPRDIGTAAETAVVKILTANGFPQCERRALRGTHDAGDLTGTPGICWSVKGGEQARAASDLQIERWLAELATQTVNAKADAGVLVVQRRAVGEQNAHRWWAVMPAFQLASLAAGNEPAVPNGFPVRMLLADAITLLRAAGYGRPAVAPYRPAGAIDATTVHLPA